MKIERIPFGGPMRIKDLAHAYITAHSVIGDLEGGIKEVRLSVPDPEKKYHYTITLDGEDLRCLEDTLATFRHKVRR